MDEEAWMAAYAAGDVAGFRALFAALAPRVRAFFLRSFGDPALADDLAQQTFLRLHRVRTEYRPGSPVRPWVFAIAGSVRAEELRRRRRRPEEPTERVDETAASEDDGPDAAFSREVLAARVRRALADLPESQRAVIHLHRHEGLSFAEIARALGTSEGAVKLRAFRGYERLRKALAGLGPEAEAA